MVKKENISGSIIFYREQLHCLDPLPLPLPLPLSRSSSSSNSLYAKKKQMENFEIMPILFSLLGNQCHGISTASTIVFRVMLKCYLKLFYCC